MANLTPEDLEFIAMLEAKAKASKQEDFRRKARIARENRAAKNLARKKKNEFKLIENSLANHPQPINNQEIELNNDLEFEVKNQSVNQKSGDKDINQEATITNESQSNTNQQIENKAIDVETINQDVTIVNQSQSNINQLENEAIDVDNINQEVTTVNESQSITNQQSQAETINQEIKLKESQTILEDKSDLNESQLNINPKIEPIAESKTNCNKSLTIPSNQEIEGNNDLIDEEKQQLEIDINDRLIWIRMSLTSQFYADNDGNIPLFWQRDAKKYIDYNFTGREYQELIDKAIALLPKDEKLLFNQLLNYQDEIDINQPSPVTNLDDTLPCEEYLPDPEIEQEYYQDETGDNLASSNYLLDTQNNQNCFDDDIKDNNQSTLKAELINDTQVDNNQLLTNYNYSQNNHRETINPNNDNSQFVSDTSNQVNSESLPIKSDNNQIKYKLIENNEELKNEIALLNNEDILGIDTETTGLDPHIHKIRLIQIASYNHPTILIDCFKCDARLIQPILINSSIKIFHNAKFDLQMFFALGLEVNQRIFDTMLAHQLVTAGISNTKASLKTIASEYLKIELNKDEQVSDWQSDKLSDSQLTYAVKDAEVLLLLREKLRQSLIDNGLTKVAKIEFDCIHAVAMMEFNGMLLDVGQWQEILKEAVKRKEELNQQLQQLLPSEVNTLFQLDINLDSPKQLLEALNRADIDCKNTNSKTLKKLLPQFPEILKPLLEYKKVSKLISSFGDSLLNKINPVTGRLHGSYNQLGSEAGRFTAKDPNLQQIPRNQETRSCFVAQPSYKLIIADYSQIELRIASELTRDKTMIEAYNNGQDLHKLTASIVLNKPLDEVTKEDRQIAKSANFGLIYGSSVNGFRGYAESNYGISLSEKEAKTIMDNFFKSYQGLAKWHKQTKSRIYNQGIDETRTLSGRIRHFDNSTPQQVLNTPVQGLGADMLKLALGKLVTAVKGLDCRILATVHDEIILEAHESIADEVAKILSEVMVSSGKEFLKLVPVEAEASIGDNWNDK